MANESTYAGITVAAIYETVFLTAREQSVILPLVTGFNDSVSSTPRIWSTYSGGTIASVAESADMSAQAFNYSPAGTLTPTQYGAMYFLTDQRINSDIVSAQRDAGTDLGELLAVHIDTNLAAQFGTLSGGTVGTAGGTLSWANIMRANAYLRAAKAPFPYYTVLRPEQWYYLTSVGTVPPLVQSNTLMDQIASGFYVGGWGGMEFFVDANITSGTAAVGGMFSRAAIAADVRRPFRLEVQRDASRGGGGFELNATMIYAFGLYRPTFGAQLIGTSA